LKSFVRTVLLAGIPFGIFWGFYFGYGKGLSSAVWSGIVAGLIGGIAAAAIARVRQNAVEKSPPAISDEVLIRQGRADHDGMTGWLYLTDRRLLFEGYPTDETAPEISTLFDRRDDDGPEHQMSMPILRIAEVTIAQPVGVVSRLDVVMTDGSKKSFTTEDLSDWVDDLELTRQSYLDEPRSESRKLFP
jgi:hypothetical protein